MMMLKDGIRDGIRGGVLSAQGTYARNEPVKYV